MIDIVKSHLDAILFNPFLEFQEFKNLSVAKGKFSLTVEKFDVPVKTTDFVRILSYFDRGLDNASDL